MRAQKRFMGRSVLACVGLGLLLIGLTGQTCTEDKDVEIVVAVELTATIPAEGNTNVYHGKTSVPLAGQVDIAKIEAEYDFEIQSVTVESAFFKIVTPQAGRTVTGTVGVCRGAECAAQTLIAYSSVAVDAPEYLDWTPAPLQAAGVAAVNAALADLVAGTPSAVDFFVDGNMTPIGEPTNFVWGALVRLNVVGVRNITVIDPI
ncbi:MAG: hypothetical protein FJY88_11050 [Candidatus Eisenbacteria bacterium]|nr:hypothetical protein [Candidatus Eisenbacteria bacterium]